MESADAPDAKWDSSRSLTTLKHSESAWSRQTATHPPPIPPPGEADRAGPGAERAAAWPPTWATVETMILALHCRTPPDRAMTRKPKEALLDEVTRRGSGRGIVDDPLDGLVKRLFTSSARTYWKAVPVTGLTRRLIF